MRVDRALNSSTEAGRIASLPTPTCLWVPSCTYLVSLLISLHILPSHSVGL